MRPPTKKLTSTPDVPGFTEGVAGGSHELMAAVDASNERMSRMTEQQRLRLRRKKRAVIEAMRKQQRTTSNDEIRRPGPDAPESNPRRQPGSPASNG